MCEKSFTGFITQASRQPNGTISAFGASSCNNNAGRAIKTFDNGIRRSCQKCCCFLTKSAVMNCESFNVFQSLPNRDDPKMAFLLAHNYCVLHFKERKKANAIADFIKVVLNFLECVFVFVFVFVFVQTLSLVICGSASFSNLLRACYRNGSYYWQ